MPMDNFTRKQAIIGIVEEIISASKTREGRLRRFRVVEIFDSRTKNVVGYMVLMDDAPLIRDEVRTLNEMAHGAESEVDYTEDNNNFSQIRLQPYRSQPVDKKYTFWDGLHMGRPKKKDE